MASLRACCAECPCRGERGRAGTFPGRGQGRTTREAGAGIASRRRPRGWPAGREGRWLPSGGRGANPAGFARSNRWASPGGNNPQIPASHRRACGRNRGCWRRVPWHSLPIPGSLAASTRREWSRCASSTEVTNCSRFLSAMAGFEYLSETTSPCSVMRSLPARRRERLRLNAAVRLPAAAVDGSSLAVEQGEAHAIFFRHLRQALLGVEESPVGRHVTAVLDGIRIPQHHFLKVVAPAQNAAIKRIGKQLLHDSRARFQIVESFEQRNDIEAGMQAAAARFHQPRLPRQQQHVPHVGGAGRHAQDVAMRRRFAVALPEWCGGREIPPAHGACPPRKVGARAG